MRTDLIGAGPELIGALDHALGIGGHRMRWIGTEVRLHGPPQRRLPELMWLECRTGGIDIAALGPLHHHAMAMQGVAIEEISDGSGPQSIGALLELVGSVLQHLVNRPGERTGCPDTELEIVAERGVHQRGWEHMLDVGDYSVPKTTVCKTPVRKARVPMKAGSPEIRSPKIRSPEMTRQTGP